MFNLPFINQNSSTRRIIFFDTKSTAKKQVFWSFLTICHRQYYFLFSSKTWHHRIFLWLNLTQEVETKAKPLKGKYTYNSCDFSWQLTAVARLPRTQKMAFSMLCACVHKQCFDLTDTEYYIHIYLGYGSIMDSNRIFIDLTDNLNLSFC